MKYFKILFLFIFCSYLISSCTKVIEIDVEDTDLKYVIEAKLIGGENDFVVLVSKTANYFTNNEPQSINTATVTLHDGSSEGIDIPLIEDGVYAINYNSVAEQEYSLTVVIEGITYEATSYLNSPIIMNDVYADELAFNPFSQDSGLDVYYKFEDPVNIENFYQSKYYVNGVELDPRENLFVFNDKFFDGIEFTDYSGDSFEAGDTVSVELLHIDLQTYNYLYTLQTLFNGGGGAPAAPGNPTNNWSGDALGYFSAYSSDIQSVVVPE